jgi:hypothetical protein
MARWPDVEFIVGAYLRASLTGTRVVTKLPANLEASLPLVWVARGPGSDDGFTDSPLMDVAAFAASRAEMWSLAEDAREAMHALAGRAVNGALVDTVDTAVGPVWLDYENDAVNRAVASYRLALRRS